MDRRSFYARAILATGLAACTALPASAAISVKVGGQPLAFGAVGPAEVGGRVLIPLRAVVEALGAEIKWDAATQTVRGSKGSREFSLRIGSQDATLNGNAARLDVPAQLMSGATMVPLRFVAEALGAKVGWNPGTQEVAIEAAEGDMVGGGRGPGGGRGNDDDQGENARNRVSGELVQLRANENPPSMVVMVDGVRETYTLAPDAVILRGAAGQRGSAVDLSDLRIGDQLQLRVNRNRARVQVVEATPRAGEAPPEVAGPLTGEIVAIRATDNERVVTIRTEKGRQTFEVPIEARITRNRANQAGQRIALNALQVGDEIKITPGRDGRSANVIETVVAGAKPPREDELIGEVIAVRPNSNPPSIVVQSDGGRAAYDLSDDTVFFRKAGNGRSERAALADIRPGDQVTLRLDPTKTFARTVDAVAGGGNAGGVTPSGDVKITGLTHTVQNTLRGGQKFRVTMTGTPGGKATVDVGNLAKDVELTEEPARPGRYSALIDVPKNVTAKGVTLTGQLQVGEKAAPLVQGTAPLTVDSQGPRVSDITPAKNATIANLQPEIYAEISDGAGSGINPASVKMTVRGKDVTPDIRVTSRFVIYSPKTNLAVGATPVVLTVADMAGNVSQTAWTFQVQQPTQALSAVTHNGSKALGAGDELVVTAKGAPKSRATFSIGENVKNIAMQETSPGVYTGRYTVKRGDQLLKAPVSVELQPTGGQVVRTLASAPVNLVTVAPKEPVITSPTDQPFRLGETLTVEGTGAPGSTIIVEVKYTGRALGVLPVQGTFGSQEVDVDKNGKWVAKGFEARLPLGTKSPELTITAVAVDPAGTRSEPATLTVKAR